MPRGCDHAVHVPVDNRYFIVEFNADGDVLRIKERKPNPNGPNYYDASWWVATSHPLGSGNTLPRRIIAAAKAKMAAEDASANATP